MNLKELFATKENPPELYWSLVLEPGWVQAGVWYIKPVDNTSKAEILGTSPAIAWKEEDELLESIDTALSACVQKLPENFPEPTKTVFGVPSSWVKEGEIKDEHLSRIKKICSELSLLPTGFVVLSEGIAHFFKSEEGSPLNAIILGLDKDSLELSVFKLGNLVGNSEVARSISLVDDVVEGLSRFEGAQPLPSRIIVYDGREEEIEEARDQLSKANWDNFEKIKFLHPPKVEAFAPGSKILATSLAGAAEIANVSSVEVENLEENKPIEEESNVKEVEESVSAEDMGFFVDKDVRTQEKEAQPSYVPLNPVTETPVLHDVNSQTHTPRINILETIKNSSSGYIEKTKNLFHSLYGKIPSGLAETSGKKKLSPILIITLVLLVGIFSLWWFLPKATVSIYVAPKKFEEVFNVSFDEDGNSDPSNNIIPGEIVSVNVNGDKTKSVTGSKLVGERSKGSVQIQNGTANPINLTTGTILYSSGNLKFTLDNSASISGALSPSSPGTSAVQVTAESIGAEYNLAKDETFKVANYPKAEVDGVVTADFSGGSSREISAVSEDDRTKLEEDLTEELINNAKAELESKLSADQILIGEVSEASVVNETFSHKVGDEADSLKLTLEVEVKAVAADKNKLTEFVRERLKDKVPQGFVLRDTQLDYTFSFDTQEENRYLFDVSVIANFLPEIKQDEIIKQISGRTPEVVETYLANVPGFVRAEIRLSPRFPGRFGTLPRVKKNISIEVVAEK